MIIKVSDSRSTQVVSRDSIISRASEYKLLFSSAGIVDAQHGMFNLECWFFASLFLYIYLPLQATRFPFEARAFRLLYTLRIPPPHDPVDRLIRLIISFLPFCPSRETWLFPRRTDWQALCTLCAVKFNSLPTARVSSDWGELMKLVYVFYYFELSIKLRGCTDIIYVLRII